MVKGGTDAVHPGNLYQMRHCIGASLETQCMSSALCYYPLDARHIFLTAYRVLTPDLSAVARQGVCQSEAPQCRRAGCGPSQRAEVP